MEIEHIMKVYCLQNDICGPSDTCVSGPFSDNPGKICRILEKKFFLNKNCSFYRRMDGQTFKCVEDITNRIKLPNFIH